MALEESGNKIGMRATCGATAIGKDVAKLASGRTKRPLNANSTLLSVQVFYVGGSKCPL